MKLGNIEKGETGEQKKIERKPRRIGFPFKCARESP